MAHGARFEDRPRWSADRRRTVDQHGRHFSRTLHPTDSDEYALRRWKRRLETRLPLRRSQPVFPRLHSAGKHIFPKRISSKQVSFYVDCQHDTARILLLSAAPHGAPAASRLPSIDISCSRSAKQQTCRRPLLLSSDGTDRRTLDRFIDPAAHTTRTVSIRQNYSRLLMAT